MGSLQWVGVLLFLWSIASHFPVQAVVSSGDVKADALVDTQNKLLKAQMEIISINATDNIDDIKSRLGVLEGEFAKLNELSDLRRGYTNGSCDIDIVLRLLINHYSSIDSQLKSLHAAVKERSDAEDQKALLNDIVEAVRSAQLTLADEKLIELSQASLIPKIIHEVYANSENNFDNVLKFAKALSKITNTYEALKSLDDEMRKNGHQDPSKLIILAETLESEVVDQPSDPNDIKSEANSTIDGLVDTIRTAATEFFIKEISSCDYKNRADIHTLAGALYVFRPEISDEVIQGLIDSTYGKVDTDTILNNICSHAITAQALTGVNALFWKLKADGKVNSHVVLNLASNLSKLQDRSEFATLSEERKQAVANVVLDIPTCARNLFLNSSNICLWNKDRNTYLIAADASLNYDTERRNIFTYSPPSNASVADEVPAAALWYVKKIDDKILFKSSTFPNEYLYVAAIDYNKEMRYVFNWIKGHNTDDQSAFGIELDGDYCRLKSLYFNEYLFASEVRYKYNESYSYVFTWKRGSWDDNLKFVWQIRSC